MDRTLFTPPMIETFPGSAAALIPDGISELIGSLIRNRFDSVPYVSVFC